MKPDRRERLLPGLLLLYFAASLVHFAHNAEHLHEYPNLPQWISRSGVYLAWAATTVTGLLGYALHRSGRNIIGVLLMALYGAAGLDGLLHYTRAPFEAHTTTMNFTILFEVGAAGILVVTLSFIAAKRLLERKR